MDTSAEEKLVILLGKSPKTNFLIAILSIKMFLSFPPYLH